MLPFRKRLPPGFGNAMSSPWLHMTRNPPPGPRRSLDRRLRLRIRTPPIKTSSCPTTWSGESASLSKAILLGMVAMLAFVPPGVVRAASLKPDPARLSVDVKLLSSDAFEGREPGTRAETRIVLFIIDRMQEAGLLPGGALAGGKRSWTQDVPLVRFTFNGPLNMTLPVGGHPQPLTQGRLVAIRAAHTNVGQL